MISLFKIHIPLEISATENPQKFSPEIAPKKCLTFHDRKNHHIIAVIIGARKKYVSINFSTQYTYISNPATLFDFMQHFVEILEKSSVKARNTMLTLWVPEQIAWLFP